MTYRISPKVAQLIEAKMASGNYRSTDELLLDALQSLEPSDEEVAAIQEGLDALDRGELGKPLNEAFADLRNRHSIQG